MQNATLPFWFLQGAKDSAPFLLVVLPFGFLFGLVATEAGLDLTHVMAFTVLVIAGAAQLTALQLMVDQAPAFIVLVSALAVNLRMAMYSAALAPWLGEAPLWQRACAAYLLFDPPYALSSAKYEAAPQMTVGERMAYYFGTAGFMGPLWCVFTYLGAVLGRGIPPAFALDFALPIVFLSIVILALRTLAHLVAAGVAIVLGLALSGLPFNLGLLPAALAAMAAGAEVERRGWARPLRREGPR